jgi:hypothetical protein
MRTEPREKNAFYQFFKDKCLMRSPEAGRKGDDDADVNGILQNNNAKNAAGLAATAS